MLRAAVAIVTLTAVLYALISLARLIQNVDAAHSLGFYRAEISECLPSHGLLTLALRLSQLSYRPGEVDPEVSEEQHVHGVDSTYARCGVAGGQSFVAFAGTHDVRNLRTNVLMAQVPRDGGKVHAGFEWAYRSVQDDVRGWAAGRQGPILVTGHSLGSALSQLCALDLAQQGHKVVNISFAPPRVGDEQWAGKFDSAVPRALHLHAKSDPITRLPPHSRGYRHTRRHFLVGKPCTRVLL